MDSIDSTSQLSASAFITKFIEIYKSSPCLWDVKGRDYFNKPKKEKAFRKLVKLTKTVDSNVDVNFVKAKLKHLRDGFRKEYRKIIASERTAQTPEDVYRPKLWYYDLLKFTLQNETDGHVISSNTEPTSNQSSDDMETEEEDLDEPPPQDAAEKEDLPTPRSSKVQMSVGNPERIRDHSPKEYRIQMVKRTDDPQPTSTKKEDECDSFAAYVAAKMRTMSREQRLYAEHYMFQVLYKGSMNQLPPPGVVTEPQYPAMMPMTFIPPEMYSHGQGRPGNGTGHYYNTPVMPGPHRNMMQKK